MHNRLQQPFYYSLSLQYQHLICGMFSSQRAIFIRYVIGSIIVPDICRKSLPVGSLNSSNFNAQQTTCLLDMTLVG